MTSKSSFSLFISIGIAFLAAGIGSLFTTPNLSPWYADLNKPWFNPPNWLFGPVWTLLFLLMAIAAWLVWQQSSHPLRKTALSGYIFQLGLNVLWSYLFFGRQSPEAALLEVFFFWLAIVATAWMFYRIDRKAGWLMVPYILWVGFASFLNYAVGQLN